MSIFYGRSRCTLSLVVVSSSQMRKNVECRQVEDIFYNYEYRFPLMRLYGVQEVSRKRLRIWVLVFFYTNAKKSSNKLMVDSYRCVYKKYIQYLPPCWVFHCFLKNFHVLRLGKSVVRVLLIFIIDEIFYISYAITVTLETEEASAATKIRL